MFYISYFDFMLKRNEVYGFFLSKGFDETRKQTKIALKFIQKQYFSFFKILLFFKNSILAVYYFLSL